MKISQVLFALAATVLTLSTARADLAANASTHLLYQQVTIMQIKGVATDVEYSPQTSNSAAFYEGSVKVTAVVEGNICTADASSFGVTQTRVGNQIYLGLVVARDASQNGLCAMYSHATEVSFTLPVAASAFDGKKVELNLGAIANGVVGNRPTKGSQLFFKAEGAKFSAELR